MTSKVTCVPMVLFLLATVARGDEFPEWKSSAGSTIHADIHSIDSENRTVTLLVPKVVSFDQLDPRSLAQARRILQQRADASKQQSTADAPPVTASSRRRGLGRSEKQLLNMLESTFRSFETNKLADGRPRKMSQAADNLSSFELIGNPDSPDSVTLLIGLPNDAPDVVIRHSAMVLRFIMNALPDWSGATDWVSSSLDTLNRRMDGKPISKVIGNAEISINVLHNISMCTVTIKAI